MAGIQRAYRQDKERGGGHSSREVQNNLNPHQGAFYNSRELIAIFLKRGENYENEIY